MVAQVLDQIYTIEKALKTFDCRNTKELIRKFKQNGIDWEYFDETKTKILVFNDDGYEDLNF